MNLAAALALTSLLALADAGGVFVEAKKSLVALKADKVRRTQRGPYEKLIRQLAQAAEGRGEGADQCQYLAATVAEDLHQASGVAADLDDAVKLNVGVADRFPRSSLADDALLRAARLLVSRRGDTEAARTLLERARKDHGKGDQAGAVKELLSRLPPPAPVRAVAAAEPRTAPAREKPAERSPAAAQPTVEEILGRFVAAAADAGTLQVNTASAQVLPSDDPAPAAAPAVAAGGGASAPVLQVPAVKANKKLTTVTIPVASAVTVREGTAVAAGKLPARFFADISPARAGAVGRALKAHQDARIAGIRVAQYDDVTVRVVMDLKGAPAGQARWDAQRKAVVIRVGEFPADPVPGAPAVSSVNAAVASAETSPARDVEDAGTSVAEVVEQARAAVDEPDAGPTLKEVKTLARELKGNPVSLSAQTGLKVRRVVIDPGHGGDDPGAIGAQGVREKDVTLKVARKVAERLRKELKMEVILTRDKDVYLPLEKRTAIANEAHADLFISIHCNSSPNRRAYGVETYYLNITDDKYAIRLAARENKETERSIGDLEFILADLAMKSNVDDSARLSKLVQANVVGELREHYTSVKDLGVKHALFYVLLGAKMPAILVETSFVSNKTEEQRLNDPKYQERLADGLVQGVRDFVEERQALAR